MGHHHDPSNMCFFLFALSCLLSGRIPWYLGAPGKVGHPHGNTMGYGNGWTPPSIFPSEWWHAHHFTQKKCSSHLKKAISPQPTKKTENHLELKTQLFPTKQLAPLCKATIYPSNAGWKMDSRCICSGILYTYAVWRLCFHSLQHLVKSCLMWGTNYIVATKVIIFLFADPTKNHW